MLDRGLQGRVALLEGVAVVIAHGAAELPVLRTLCAARIACHHSYSPQEGGEGGRGEDVVIAAVEVVAAVELVFVVEVGMFVAQSDAEVGVLIQCHSILDEACIDIVDGLR